MLYPHLTTYENLVFFLKLRNQSIPENIVVDLAGLDIGASVKISSVKLPDNTKPTITDRDFVVATIAPPTIVKEPEKPAEGTAEGTEGDAAAPAEGDAAAATSAEPGKDPDASKKDDKSKGKEQSGDKKSAAKPAAEKKTRKKINLYAFISRFRKSWSK